MVDRITPATKPVEIKDDFSDGIRKLVRETYGIEDQWPVIAEYFSQWVIEDDFVGPRGHNNLLPDHQRALLVKMWTPTK